MSSYRHSYLARINAEPCKTGEFESANLCKCSDELSTIKDVKEYVEKHNWKVGETETFTYKDWTSCVNPNDEPIDKRFKLKIESIEYLEKNEKIDCTYKNIDPDVQVSGVKKKKPVMYVNVRYFNEDGTFDQTYTVLSNGDDYMEKLHDYFREYGIKIPFNSVRCTVSFKVFEDQNVIV